MSPVIWITGAAGYCARHLAANLRRTEPDAWLVGLARDPKRLDNFNAWHSVDVTDFKALKHAVEMDPPDLVYHLAGATHPASEEAMWFTNGAGTRLLIEAVAGSGKPGIRVLVASSAAVYQPTSDRVDETASVGGANAYGRSKWAQELVSLASGREFGVDIVIARTFNLIGPGLPQRLLAGAVCELLKEPGDSPISLGDLSSFRDYLDVRDAVEAYRLLAAKGRHNQIYNVCRGRATCSRTLVQRLATLAAKPARIQECASHYGGGVYRSIGNPGALMALGWKPSISLHRSLCDMLDYVGVHSHQLQRMP